MSFKFNVGDKIQVCSNIRNRLSKTMIGFAPVMQKYQGKVATIKRRFITSDGENAYYIDIDEGDHYGRWTWAEEWLEPEKSVTISFNPYNKLAAYKAVEEAIEDYFASREWTEEEISKAKEMVGDMVREVVVNGGDVCFDKCSRNDKAITASICKDCFDIESRQEKTAEPYGQDVFNPWIGKCVALCAALHRPTPDFIANKNKRK